jgi:hypothetical protein
MMQLQQSQQQAQQTQIQQLLSTQVPAGPPPAPPAPEFNEEKVAAFGAKEHLPAWAREISNVLAAYFQEMNQFEIEMEDNFAHGTAHAALRRVWESMTENQRAYEDKWGKKVQSGETKVDIREKGGRRYWVKATSTSEADWVDVTSPPDNPCRSCMAAGTPKPQCYHWFWDCPKRR